MGFFFFSFPVNVTQTGGKSTFDATISGGRLKHAGCSREYFAAAGN